MGFLKDGINEERERAKKEVEATKVVKAEKAKEDQTHNTAYYKVLNETILPVFEEAIKDLATSNDMAQAILYSTPSEIEKLIGAEQKEVTAVLCIIIPKTKEKLLIYSKKTDAPSFELKFKTNTYGTKSVKYNVNNLDRNSLSNDILIWYLNLTKN